MKQDPSLQSTLHYGLELAVDFHRWERFVPVPCSCCSSNPLILLHRSSISGLIVGCSGKGDKEVMLHTWKALPPTEINSGSKLLSTNFIPLHMQYDNMTASVEKPNCCNVN